MQQSLYPNDELGPTKEESISISRGEPSSLVYNGDNSYSHPQVNYKREKRRQSMLGNLKKLYYYDQKDDFVPSTFTSSVPQDQERIHPNQADTQQLQESKDTKNGINFAHFGRLSRAKDICIHNGEAAQNARQYSKADVWNLLAEVLDNMASGVGDEYNGWKGFSFGVIHEILTYYERQGDVQMLATIVSVIGRRGRNSIGWRNNEENDQVLPFHGDSKRYDIYVHLYANLLYSWGRVETSAELKKHLHSSPSHDFIAAESCGLIFAPRCLQCEKVLSPKTHACRSCNSYAFQCSICTNSVRGLFTVCFSCGHGGHFEHLMQWFSEHSVCPTGCGCKCNFNTICGTIEDKPFLTTNQQQLG